ncbi:hypothetical protein JYU34_010255 [Plutella xylostella]|uniref:Secreted protein n=1 Tax=Plutella xylostella TaxID=51655 RepID=A0ABQ7QIW6_PLUXY|nr:hypothetical protein JYU34_010255 [Plutella xylostella]
MYGQSNRLAIMLRMLLVLARTRRTRDAHRLRIVVKKQSTRASANIPDALQNRGSLSNILNALLYCTRSTLYAPLVHPAHKLQV